MIFMANPCSSTAITARMLDGTLGFIDTPLQQNIRPAGVTWCADNGCFSASPRRPWTEERWWAFLERHAHDTARCLFATAPDVVGDAHATAIRFRKWGPMIRALGYKAAYVLQDGATDALVPFDDLDALFIGGSTEFKLGETARHYAAEAKARGKWLHMGRVNSGRRCAYAASIDCDSVDGTFLRFAPDHNLGRLLRWPGINTTPREHVA